MSGRAVNRVDVPLGVSIAAEARDSSTIRLRVHKISQARNHYGCKCLLVMLRPEGRGITMSACIASTKKGVCLYAVGVRTVAETAVAGSRSRWPQRPIPWGMDIVSDALFDGRRYRLLPVLDHFIFSG